MPDMWIDVDTAVTVPVNLMPLIDDGDFKTRETSVAYDATGMDLVWNFATSAGVITQTAVTPTTSGSYDWSHVGDGIYKIEIPASGGASINNDTEGYGWFSGIATGVLPWRGPVIGFRAAALNDALCDGGDLLDVNVTQLGGATQSATDLKDFADDGYDPSTNKVQGVVLTDTVTTYTGNTPQTGDAYAKVDTEVAALQSDLTAVKAKTDNLPSDPADASDIAAAFSTVNSTLSTIAAYIDTEIAAIKIKTDTIPASPAAVGSAMTLEDGAITAAKIASDALSAVKIATDACQKIADIMLRRGSANIEASSNGDTLAFKSLYGAIAMQTHEKDASSGTSLEVMKADGSTTLATITLDTDAAAEPIVGTGSA